MSINAKHLATFILGAAAGVAAHKYLQTEEGEKLLEDLKTKGSEALKNNFPDAESFLKDLFDKFTGNKGATTGAVVETPDPVS
jgi:hypothetical protein